MATPWSGLRRAATGVAIAAAVALVVSASGSAPHGAPGGPTPEQSKAFTGPWAHELAQAYEAGAPAVRQILDDGVITDAELSEVTERYRSCLESFGITFIGRNDDGGTRFSFPLSVSADDANRHADACAESSGDDAVAGLLFEVRRNPQHLDESTIMAACLVKKKLVPREYDASAYAADAARQVFPFSGQAGSEEAFQQCVAHPIG